MKAASISVPWTWRQSLAVARGLLAGTCLVLAAANQRQLPALLLLAGLFAIYSLPAFFWRRLERAGFSLLLLCVDTVFFFLCATYSPVRASWMVALFYLFLLLHASLLHSWREVILVAAICASFLFLASPPTASAVSGSILVGSVVAAVLALQRRTIEERLAHSSRESVLFRAEADRARETERQRIAADFHDGPVQSFMSFQMRLEVVRRLFQRDAEKGMAELTQLQEFCRAQVAELRSYIRGMRPMEVDAGLSASVRRLTGSFQKDTGISATFLAGDFKDPSDSEVCLEVLQVIREALHNVQKHSRASRVAVALQRADGQLEISIDDDGTGFPFSGSYSLGELDLLRAGPGSIKRRVRSLNGQLWLESQPGRGAALKIRIPL
ncbi:MAG: sensor histidine kinase [Acidobacteria bacterium]|nr:sensor histidine kinase [Acidobacteriota bacterium]